mmetsp:Transcript_97976/g.261555  ORF Transcript_97976/g.261555 Transcript_97976/m.261555 type:complete len:229 (-) Transcript_97976:8-694(-)
MPFGTNRTNQTIVLSRLCTTQLNHHRRTSTHSAVRPADRLLDGGVVRLHLLAVDLSGRGGPNRGVRLQILLQQIRGVVLQAGLDRGGVHTDLLVALIHRVSVGVHAYQPRHVLRLRRHGVTVGCLGRHVDHTHGRLLQDARGRLVKAVRARRSAVHEWVQGHLDLSAEVSVELLQIRGTKILASRSLVAEEQGELHCRSHRGGGKQQPAHIEGWGGRSVLAIQSCATR